MKKIRGLIATLIVFSFIITSVNIFSTAPRVNPNDWNISQPTTIKNQVKILDGNLTILSTGKLTLDNATLILNCSSDGEFKIEIMALGELNVINNSTIRSFDSNFRYDFYYNKNSKGQISNSFIMNAGWDYFTGSHGLYIESDNIIIDNCIFNYNYIDIWIITGSPVIKNNKLLSSYDSESIQGEQFQLGGINLRGSNTIIQNNIIKNSGTGIRIEGDNSRILNNSISNIFYDGISLGTDSNPYIKNNSIINCNQTGIGLWYSLPKIINNDIESCNFSAIALYGSSPTINNCTIKDSGKYDIWLREDSHPIIINTSFDRNKLYFEYWNGANPSLILQWYLKIRVVDENNNPINNANIIIKNLKNIEIFNKTTNSNGFSNLIACSEFTQQDNNNDTDGNDNGEKNYLTPHNITVSIEYKNGIYKFSQDVIMNKNEYTIIKVDLNRIIPDLKIHTDDIQFSNNNPIQGEMIKINATVHNLGETTVKSADVKFYYNEISGENQIGDTQTIKNLNPETDLQISIDWNTTNFIGNHTILVLIDNSDPGEYNISNNIASKEIFIEARNKIPYANLDVNRTELYANEMILFNGSGSYDEDGYIAKYLFDFDDGNISNWLTVPQVEYKYLTSGMYYPTLHVMDNAGEINTNVAQIELTVKNNIPIITDISIESLLIEPSGFSNITIDASDKDGDKLEYIYETTNGTISGSGSSVIWQAPSVEGNYSIIIKVNDGKQSSISKIIYIVVKKKNTPPVIINVTVEEEKIGPGESTKIIVEAYDPDIDDIITYYYNTSDGYITGSGSEVSWEAPNKEGIYEIQITVKDASGEEAIDMITIFVEKELDSTENDQVLIYTGIVIILIIIIIFLTLFFIRKGKRKLIKANEESVEVEPIDVNDEKEI